MVFKSNRNLSAIFPIDLRAPRLKFIYSEKATKFCEIFTLLLSYLVPVKSMVKFSQNFVAFSEYMNFINMTSDKRQMLAEFMDI